MLLHILGVAKLSLSLLLGHHLLLLVLLPDWLAHALGHLLLLVVELTLRLGHLVVLHHARIHLLVSAWLLLVGKLLTLSLSIILNWR